jgi:GNAT superfamily N-acetyltransferase
MLTIYPLYKKRSLYPILAYWSFNNWYIHRNVPFRLVLHDYRRRASMSTLPFSFIAMWNDIPAGMISIKEADLANRNDLTPWLSALFVAPEFRKKNIGSSLIDTVLAAGKRIGYKRIFLFIDNRNMNELEDFYLKRGWIFLDRDKDSDGKMTKILFHEL